MKTELLDQRAFEGLSRLVKEQFKNCGHYLKQIEKRENEESLHDFRVSLRRLRIWLRVVGREPNFAATKNDLKHIKKLVRLTNEARDLDVRLSLLRQHLALSELDDALALDLQEKWRSRIKRDYKHLLKAAARDLKHAEPGIKGLISKIKKQRTASLSLTFREWLTPVLVDYAQKTDSALFQINSIEDRQKSHEARLLAKALRYLVEPLSNDRPGVSALLSALRRLQDLIGGLRDAQMLAAELDKTIQKSKSKSKVQALKNALERNANEIHYLYGELQSKFLRAPEPFFQNKVKHLL